MMPALSILFCWLLSRSEGNDPKRRSPHAPSISVNPSWRVLEGSDVTIHCESPYSWRVTFSLWKGNHTTSFVADVDGRKANFSINRVNRDDGGLYSCSYYSSNSSLERSESLELLITDPSLPRPEISIHPSRSVALGTEVKIHCKTRDGPMKFYLHLTGRTTVRRTMEPDFDMAEFSIHNVSWEHQGKYSCSYAYLERPFLFSAFSDPVELLISDDELSSSRIHIGSSIAGLFFLFLIFGLILCYKRRRDDEPQPVLKNRDECQVLKPQRDAKPACYLTEQDIPVENLPPESSSQTQTKNIIYAELKQKSLDIQGVEELDDDTEACIYTTVIHRTRNQD